MGRPTKIPGDDVILLQKTLNGSSRLLFSPFERWGTGWLVVWASLLTALLVLVVYRFFSSPKAIHEAKDRLKAHILEIRLFQYDPILTARAFRDVLATNLRYLGLNVKPFLVLVAPVLLILVQLEARLGYRPLLPGESAVIRTFWSTPAGTGNQVSQPNLLPFGDIVVQTPPLRIADGREVDWRILAGSTGDARFTIRYGGHAVTLPVSVSNRVTPISTRSVAAGSLEGFLYPASLPLPPDGKLRAIEICYPHRSLWIAGHRMHWIWPYLVLSLVAGYLLKGFFGVTF